VHASGGEPLPFDHDEFDSLFQEEGGGRVPEAVEPDAAESGPVEKAAEAAGEVGGVERLAVRGGEDEAVVRPARSGRLALFLLPFLEDLEGVDAFGGEGDAALGGQGLGVQTLAAGLLERTVDGGGTAVEVVARPPSAPPSAPSATSGHFLLPSTFEQRIPTGGTSAVCVSCASVAQRTQQGW
jgi:hypothetical protein